MTRPRRKGLGTRPDLALATEEVARYVVRLEGGIRPADGTDADRVVDTPGAGILLALQLFGPLRPGTLAELGAMTTGAMSKRIDRLERASLVRRRLGAVPDDHRAVVVEITGRGRREVGRVERVARASGPELLRALEPLATGGPTGPAPTADPTSDAPVLSGLFRLVSLLDQTVLRAVGRFEVLHPTDPRPLLLLADLDRQGPRTPGSIPVLIDRSRSASHRLVRRLADAGLLTTAAQRTAGGGSLVGITPAGSRAFRSVVAALAEDLPELQPAIADLARSLTDDAT